MKATWMKLAAVGLVFAAAVAGEMYMARAAGAGMEPAGYVYTLNNDGQQNGVVVLARGANGTLTQISGSPVATGGKGIVVPEGGDFDAQGSVRIHGRFLFAVNPGSNSVAVFAIGEGGRLTPAPGSPYPSSGVTPLSVSANGDLVYVANQSHAYAMSSQAPNITGFRMSGDGRLSPIPGSTVEFPSGQGPAQVEFSPKGGVLAVTAGFQTDGRIYTFAVQPDGTLKQGPGSPFVTREVSGTVGFSWSADSRRLLVSNFRGSAMTVFNVDSKTGAIEPLGAAYPNGGGAACWTAISPDGRTLYTGNYVGNSVSAYAVNADGTLKLLGTMPRRGAMRPDTKDIAMSPDGKYLYAVGPVGRQVAVFEIGADRLPRELDTTQSPSMIPSGQWTTGLAIN
jgi:6-phosphogluconolactonase (cycloisomerase 2 family)